MRSLVTGGAGFIGSHLVDALAEAGDEVLVIDDLSVGRRENLSDALARGVELRVGDITDHGSVDSAFADLHPQRCFHLAAQADVRRALADPALDARVNVLGTINVLEAARHGATPVTFASTGGAIYGEGDKRHPPLDEAVRCEPESPYGMSKLAAEGYLELFARAHRVPGAALRLGNVYGPRQDPSGEAGVIAIFCGRLLGGDRPTVFGDGLQTRDYVYVTDVVAALLAAADRLTSPEDSIPGVLNVGTGTETSVLELVKRLAELSGDAEFEPEHAPARPGEIQRIALDSGAARRALGWAPETDLGAGLALTLESFRRG
ncbi:MAG: NAD-dependent epimerase/dehydratase family protein [Solirubrobacterales bacterium]